MREGSILITGAAGFLGSYLTESFHTRGYRVVGVDNLFRGKMENLAALKDAPGFTFYKLDLAQFSAIEALRDLLIKHEVEAVYHLAAINGTEYFYDASYMVLDVNIRTTQVVMDALEGTSVKYIAYTSSSEAYGEPMQVPTPETHPILLNAFADRDSYASAKAIGDYYVRLAAAKYNIKYLILRVFNMYGPRMVGTKYGQVIGEFAKRALQPEPFTIIGDGRHTRSFCLASDATEAMVDLYEIQHTGILNIGNDDEMTILELAKIIHEKVGRPFEPVFLPERPNDHKRRCPDTNLLRSLLPDMKFTSLDEGLDLTIQKFRTAVDA